MKPIPTFFLLALISLLTDVPTALLHGQKVSLPQGTVRPPPIPPFRFQHSTVEDGLPAEALGRLYEDRAGFVWGYSDAGMCRFDGRDFVTYPLDHKQQGNLADWRKSPFSFKQAGLEGLWYFDPKHDAMRVLPALGSLRMEKDVQPVLTDGDTVWYWAPSHKLFKVNVVAAAVLDSFDCSVAEGSAVHGLRSRSGDLYFSFKRSLALLRIRAGQSTTEWLRYDSFYPLNSPTVSKFTCHNLIEDSDEWLWMGTWSYGLLGYCPASGQFRLYRATGFDRFRRVERVPALTGDSILWCMDARNGIFLFNLRRRAFVQHLLYSKAYPDGLADDQIFDSMLDHRGILWLSTISGLSRLDEQDQHIFPLQAPEIRDQSGQPVPFDVAPRFSMVEEAGGERFWVPYGKFAFGQFDPLRKSVLYRFDVVQNGSHLRGSVPIRAGQPDWVFGGLKDTLFLYNTSSGKHQVVQLPPIPSLPKPVSCIPSIFQTDGPETLWIGTNEGLIRFDLPSRRVLQVYRPQPDDSTSLSEKHVNALHLDAKHRLWVATSGGLNRLDPEAVSTGWFRRYSPHVVKDNSNYINDVATDSRGIVWCVAFGLGLLRLDPDTDRMEYFTPDSTKSARFFCKMHIDGLDRIWASTADGLYLFDPTTRHFEHFTKADGLPFPNFDFEGPFFPFRDGVGITGRNGQFTFLRPERVRLSNARPTVYIRSLRVLDRLLPFDADSATRFPVVLNYDDRYLRFDFTTPVFSRRHHVRFRYRMLGFDETWRDADTEQSALYANLPPGSYTFQVAACADGGHWSEMPAECRVRVRPPWWRTAWFISLVMFFLLAATWFFYKNRLRQKEMLIENQRVALENQTLLLERAQAFEQERNRIASELHDDLGSGLSTIRFLSERALSKETDPQKRVQVEKISCSAAELVERMRDIIWAMNGYNDSLENLLTYLRAYALDYFETHGITCQFALPDALPDVSMSGERRRNVLLAVKEALHNIVKHARADRVEVTVRFNGQLDIEIRDNGQAPLRPPQAGQPSGNGLRYMKKRMEAVGGSFQWEDTSAGVRVRFGVPLEEGANKG